MCMNFTVSVLNWRPDHDFGRPEHEIDYIDNCTSDDCPSDPKFKQEDKNHHKFDQYG